MNTQEILNEARQYSRLFHTDTVTWSFNELREQYLDGLLNVRPEYQRGFIWNDTIKTKLIESFVMGLLIPPIFVHEYRDYKYDVIDGVQRVCTILEFLGALKDIDGKQLPNFIIGDCPYVKSLCKIDYTKLDKDNKRFFDRFRIRVFFLKNVRDAQIVKELFKRLNTPECYPVLFDYKKQPRITIRICGVV